MIGPDSLTFNNGGTLGIVPAAWPTNTGLHLGATAVGGIVVAHIKQLGSTRRAPIGTLSSGFHFPDWDGATLVESGDTNLDLSLSSFGGTGGTRLDITLPQGSKGIPRNVTSVLVRISCVLNVAAPWAIKTFAAAAYYAATSNRSIPIVSSSYGYAADDSVGQVTINWIGWVPLWKTISTDALTGTNATILSLMMTHLSSDVTSLGAYTATVSGYRLE